MNQLEFMVAVTWSSGANQGWLHVQFHTEFRPGGSQADGKETLEITLQLDCMLRSSGSND